MYLIVCTCIMAVCCAILHVLAQTSTGAVPSSPNRPQLGRHPAGPTQGTPGQQPDHFVRSSVTDRHTRFCALVRAARVGGAQSTPPAPPMGLLRTLGPRGARLKPHPSRSGYVALLRGVPCGRGSTAKTAPDADCRMYVCVCMCMYVYVLYVLYVCACMSTKCYIYIVSIMVATAPVAQWHIQSHMDLQAGVQVWKTSMGFLLIYQRAFAVPSSAESLVSGRNLIFLLSPCQKIHTYTYTHIHTYTYTYIVIHTDTI